MSELITPIVELCMTDGEAAAILMSIQNAPIEHHRPVDVADHGLEQAAAILMSARNTRIQEADHTEDLDWPFPPSVASQANNTVQVIAYQDWQESPIVVAWLNALPDVREMDIVQNSPFSDAFEMVMEYNQKEQNPEVDVSRDHVAEWMWSEGFSSPSEYNSLFGGTTVVESRSVVAETPCENAIVAADSDEEMLEV